MFISRNPEASYWESEWNFPKTGTCVSIALPGDESGPFPESREFYFALPAKFDEIMNKARPKVAAVFRDPVLREWFNSEDFSSELKLTGFGLEDARATPIKWDVSFETMGDKWLGITIPFVGDIPQDAIVDT